MPRNSGTGVYSPPPNITAVPGATVESADWNVLVQDLTAAFNTPWPVGLGGTGVSSLAGFLSTIGGLPLSGGTLTGPLTLSGDATGALQPVTKQQLDTKAAATHTHTTAAITDFSTATDARIASSSVATPTTNGLLSATDKTKLNGLTPVTMTTVDLGLLTGGLQTASHGISGGPTFIVPSLRCETSDAGYPVGFTMPIAINGDQLNSTGVFAGFTSTQVMARVSGQIAFVRYDTGATTYGVPGSWRAIIRCVKIG